MEPMTLIFILAAMLITPVGFSIYDAYRHKAENSMDQHEQEQASKIYHAAKFWTILGTTLVYMYGIFKLMALGLLLHVSIYNLISWLPLMMTLYWIVFDIYWNKTNGLFFLYPGNGRGGFIEERLYKFSKWIKASFMDVTVYAKMLALFVSIILFVKYGF